MRVTSLTEVVFAFQYFPCARAAIFFVNTAEEEDRLAVAAACHRVPLGLTAVS